MTLTKDIIQKSNLFFEDELQKMILIHGSIQTFSKGDIIVREGQFVKVLPIVISGNIRVFQTHEDREILLYYVKENQTCMMSLSACFYDNKSPSQAVVTCQTEILIIPTKFISDWQKKYPSWNNFVIRTFRDRYDELLNSFTNIVFKHIDDRLIEYLTKKAHTNNNREVKISHQELAYELGTTRVVISRILKQLEHEGLLELHRGLIKVS